MMRLHFSSSNTSIGCKIRPLRSALNEYKLCCKPPVIKVSRLLEFVSLFSGVVFPARCSPWTTRQSLLMAAWWRSGMRQSKCKSASLDSISENVDFGADEYVDATVDLHPVACPVRNCAKPLSCELGDVF